MEIFLIIGLGIWIFFIHDKVGYLLREVKSLKESSVSSLAQNINQAQSEKELKEMGVVTPEMPESRQAVAAPFGGKTNLTFEEVAKARAEVGVPQAPQSVSGNHAIEWLKEDFLVKLGAFLLLLAVGWFVTYAIVHHWIGPAGQIFLGLLLGLSFMVLGVWRIKTHPHQGGIFTVLGSTTVLLTLFAARESYGFFTPLSALFIMALSIVFVSFMSVRFNRNQLALAGLILAGIAPILFITERLNVLELFSYLTVVLFGTLWVVYLRGWSNLTFASLVIVFLHGLPYLGGAMNSGDKDMALLFTFLFTAVFFVANIIGVICNENEKNKQAHIAIGLGTGFYLILWIIGAASDEWQTLLLVAWMLVFSVGSFIVYRALENKVPFYIYGGTSLVLLAAATANEFEGPTLTLAFTVEVALLVFLSTYILRNVRIASSLSWLFAIPTILSFESIASSAWAKGIFHDDFFVVLLLGIALAVVGRFLYELQNDLNDTEAHVGKILMILASLYGVIMIWLVLHAGSFGNAVAYQSGTTLTLIVYTLIGLGLYVYGKQNEYKTIRVGGGSLLGFVVGHLLLIDVWDMETIPRIITFFAVGILLISTAFIRSKKKNQFLPQSDNDNV